MIYSITDAQLSSLAIAIRTKLGVAVSMSYPSGFIQCIRDMDIFPIFENGVQPMFDITGYFIRSCSIGTQYRNSNQIFFISDCQCSKIAPSAFAQAFNLKGVRLTSLTNVPTAAFQGCRSLASVIMPRVTIINQQAFTGCTSLSRVFFPSCTRIEGAAFSMCTALSEAHFPNCNYIGAQAFKGCTSLSKFYLMYSSIAILSGVSVFFDTPIQGTGIGKIYVPASLLASYKTATNWAAYSDHLIGI